MNSDGNSGDSDGNDDDDDVQAPPVSGDHHGEKEDVYDHYIGSARFGGLLF